MTTVAVIGCGVIANSAHFPALSEMDNVRIKYACDIIREKAELVKEKFPKVENVIEDYKIALNDSEVDVIYVLTPNYMHYVITMDALRANKHVFCEKPITVNYKLSLEMAEEAEKRGKMLNIGVCNRYSKPVEALHDWVQEGKFGKIYHINCMFRAFRSIPGLGGPFTTKAMSGGGVLIDWGVHFFDLILYILGGAKIKNVTCDAYSEMAKDMKAYKHTGMWSENTSNIETGTNDVDDYISGYIRTDKGSISFNGAWAQNVGINEMYVDFLGDKGGARLNYGGNFTFWDASNLQSITPEFQPSNTYLSEDTAFIESIKTGVKNKNNIKYVLESAKLLQALYDSSDAKKEIIF